MKNITDIRAWFGVINQISYAFSMTEYMHPFRELLKPTSPFYWNEQLNDIFERSKIKIVEEVIEGVRIFDTSKPTYLATDWCKIGIGHVLLQKHCSCPDENFFAVMMAGRSRLMAANLQAQLSLDTSQLRVKHLLLLRASTRHNSLSWGART